MKENKFKYLKEVILILVLLLIPTLGGLGLFIATKDLIYWEVFYVVFGLLELLVLIAKTRFRDSRNFRKNKTLYEDKKTDEYKAYIKGQWTLFICAILSFACSLIVYIV